MVTRRSTNGIKVAGEDDVMVRYGKCCSPLPGDPIVGFITRGRGVTVHTLGCSKGLDQDPDRRVEVEWDGKQKTPRPVSIQVLCADKPGLLAHISQSFSEAGVNISQANCRATDDNRAVNTFVCNVADLETLKGQVEFHHAARALGVKAITGVELRAGHAPHALGSRSGRLVLLARDRGGYESLCRILTLRHGRPERDAPAGGPVADTLACEPRGLFFLSDDAGALARLERGGAAREDVRLLLAGPGESAGAQEPEALADFDIEMLDASDVPLRRLLLAVQPEDLALRSLE